MSDQEAGYLSYLLRLWQENKQVPGCPEDKGRLHHPAVGAVWRVSLETSLTGRVHGFASLDDAVAFLRRQTGEVSDTGDAEAPMESQQETRSHETQGS